MAHAPSRRPARPHRRSATRAKGRDFGHGEGGDRCLGGLRSPRWAETCLEKLTPLRSALEPARRRSGGRRTRSSEREEPMTRPRSADDFATIRARMVELRRERERAEAAERELQGDPPTHRARNVRWPPSEMSEEAGTGTPTWIRYAARSRQSLVGSARVGCAATRLAVGGAASSTDLAVASSAAVSASIRDSGTAVAGTDRRCGRER